MTAEEFAKNAAHNMAELEQAKFTMQEAANALLAVAPAMQQAWDDALANDDLWKERAKQHGRVRTWLLRWRLRHGR